MFLLIILFLILMVNAVFAWIIANLFINFPGSVLPIFIEIPLAVLIGLWVYKRRGRLLVPSLIALAIMYAFIWVGYKVPIDVRGWVGQDNAFVFWIVVLMVYGLISSVLPVWVLLQPRDYINSHQLFLGLIVLYLGLFILQPDVTAPAVNTNLPEGSPPLFPLLFITIACGAISGFHGLVASGTSSKQLDKETDARYVGYFGAIGEGALGLLSVIACATAFATLDDWQAHYATFQKAGDGALSAFVLGASQLAEAVGIPRDIGAIFISVLIISFAATSLDTSFRLLRYILVELGNDYKIRLLQNGNVAATVGVLVSLYLVFSTDGGKGIGSGGYVFWPLFGTTNQLLAGLSLLVITVWLKRLGRNYLPTLVPMVFVFAMTLWAMVLNIQTYFAQNKVLLYTIGSAIFVLALWMILEAVNAFRKQHTPPGDHTASL